MGICNIVQELTGMIDADLFGDSSACCGTLHREGAGKMKHLEVKQLWLQERIKNGSMRYNTIPRDDNSSDSLAKPWGRDGPHHFAMLGFFAGQAS